MGDTLPHMLINPNQLRVYCTEVQDNPFSGEPLQILLPGSDTLIPLNMAGTTIHATTQAPSDKELATLFVPN